MLGERPRVGSWGPRVAGWLALLVACRPAATVPPPRADPPVAALAPSTPEPAPVPAYRRLAPPGVYHDDYARTVLYTWTTAAQVEALRASRRLLVAESKAGIGASVFLRGLSRVARDRGEGHALAALLLDHPDLRRRRYAWTSPFATTMGLGPVRYGDALVRVDLDERSVIVRFKPADAAPFAAVDVRGAPVDLAALIADPGRIAAVYHVRDGPGDEVPFREYVLVNEARIAAWSLATPEIRAQVDADLAWLAARQDGPFAWLPAPAVGLSAAPAWAGARPQAHALDLWHASLAFDNRRYRPSLANLAAIVATMRGYDGGGAPLVVRPHAAPGGAPAPSHASQ